jgi:hypothetical protein
MRDLEDVPERVTNHRSPIAIGRVERLLEHLGTGVDGALERLVGVVDVDVQERRERFALSRRRDHDDGVTHLDVRRSAWLDIASCGEHLPEEADLRGNVVDEDTRRD